MTDTKTSEVNVTRQPLRIAVSYDGEFSHYTYGIEYAVRLHGDVIYSRRVLSGPFYSWRCKRAQQKVQKIAVKFGKV